jgi:uncharacterized protein (DUF1800 family)
LAQDRAFARHIIDRIGYGPRPGDVDRIAADGGERWLDAQLNPASIALPSALSARVDRLPTLRMSPTELFLTYGPPSYRPPQGEKITPEALKAGLQKSRVIAAEAVEARLALATESPRQLEERLVEFWFNHFNVFAGKGLDHLWIGAYERDAIRPHVLGKFRDLLGATAKHPAMLFYLDNWQNTAPGSPGARGKFTGLNENYARELMELHTLGVAGGYTQDDVIALARILTGWGFPPRRDQQPRRMRLFRRVFQEVGEAAAGQRRAFFFDPDRHDGGNKTLLGQRIDGHTGSRGIDEGEHALDLIAHHPATAHHVSFKLAQFFVADAPDTALIDAMATTFQSTGGDLKAVTRVLLHSDAFRDPANFGTRFKTPYQYVVSAVRATGAEVRNVRPLYGMLAQLGQPLYACQTPDGFKCTCDAWLNADAMTRRISFAVALGAGRLPIDRDPDPRINVKRPDRMAEKAEPMLRAPATPVDAEALTATLAERIAPATRAAMRDAPPPLKPGLLLGSPEFMTC